MPQRPWAIDDLIIHDETNLRSVLIGGDGLPAARGWLAQRYGYWPRVSGLARQGYRMTLETYLLHSTPAERLAARTALLQHLNPELEEMARLTAVDYVLRGVGRDGVLLAMGPWDVYCDDDAAWHVRDILRPDELEADLSGGWQIGFDGGLQMGEAITNLEPNPSFEVDTAGWAANGTNTIERSDEQARIGCYSLKCTYQDSVWLAYDSITLTAVAHSLSAWVYVPSSYDGTDLRLYFTGFAGGVGTAWAAVDLSIRDEWQLVMVPNYTPDAGDLAGFLVLLENGAPTAGRYVYLDAVQCEAKAYCTPYCDGSLGPGHSWSGADHASTSSRTAAVCAVPIADIGVDFTEGSQGAIVIWLKRDDWDGQGGTASAYGFRAYLDANDYVEFFWNSAGPNLRGVWYGDGNYDFSGNLSGYTDGEYSQFVVTWDFTGSNQIVDFYFDGQQQNTYTNADPLSGNPTTLYIGSDQAGAKQWNGVVGNVLCLGVHVSDGDVTRLYAIGVNGLNARWMDVLCEGAVPWAPGGVAALDRGLVSTLLVDGNVRWRQRDGDVAFWRIYDDEWDLCLDVDSDDDVWPEFRITPRTAKTTGFTYRQWIPIKWDDDAEAGETYPVLLGTFNLTGKAQADGDDIRVFCNGEEIDRWLGGALVGAVKVWVNLDFETCTTMTLVNDIAAAGDVDYIEVSESITDLPSEGILYIGTEAFYYTSKNSRTRRFSGIYRATRDTTAAAHLAGNDVFWIQNDVWIYYGDATLTAPDTDDDYKPAFDIDNSTNASWIYTEFGEDDGLRAAQWVTEIVESLGGAPTFYTADHGGNADPWEEIGIFITSYPTEGRYRVYCACGISNVNFSNGEKRDQNKAVWDAEVQSSIDTSSWATEYDIPAPALDNNWEAWNYNAAIAAGSFYAGLWLSGCNDINDAWVECADVTLTITNPPVVASAGEVVCYQLACTITNEETDEAMTVEITLVLDQTLIVDTYTKTVRLDDGTPVTAAITLDEERRDWLRLVPGGNRLAFEDVGTQELDIDVLWHRRLFE